MPKKAKNIKYLPDNKVQVFYDDGSTSTMTIEQARQLGLAGTPVVSNAPTGTVAAPTTTLTPGSYATDSLTNAFTDPTTGGQVSGSGLIPTASGYKSISDLVLQARNPKNLSKIRGALVTNGLISKGTKSITTIQNTWLQVLIGSQSSQVDPFEYMKQLKAGGFGAETAGADNIPTKQIYRYTPQQVSDMVDETAQGLVGRTLNEDDKTQTWYKDLTKSINKMINAGTVTKTVTKGGMKVVETTPGITKEGIATKAKEAITTNLVDDVDRKRRSDFATWLFDKIGGK
jgi:hypothetical protein